jgi:hypothetical protein
LPAFGLNQEEAVFASSRVTTERGRKVSEEGKANTREVGFAVEEKTLGRRRREVER